MVGSGKVQRNLQGSKDLLLELAGKNGVSISCDDCRRAMKFEYVVHEYGCDLLHCIGMRKRQEMRVFCQSVDDDQDNILAL
jgi:hypothetical protein